MIKKLFVGLLVLSFLVLPAVTKAYTLTDAKKQIQSLTAEIASLKSQMSAAALKAVTTISTPVTITKATVVTDYPVEATPRIAYWQGKVNQHIDANGVWLTDPDGRSGAELDKLTYCKKFYPNTLSVREYHSETITGWREGGNIGGPYTLAVVTTECVKTLAPAPTPTITILSPNGGQIYQVGQMLPISWTTNADSTKTVKVYLSYTPPNGIPVEPVFSSSSGGVGSSFNWQIPASMEVPYFSPISTGQYKLKVSVFDSNGTIMATDYSDTSFTIQAAPTSQCVINSFTANPLTITTGGTSTLNWSTAGCGIVGVDSSMVSTSGALAFNNLTQSQTFTLFAGASLPAGCSSFMGYSLTTGQSCSIGSVTRTASVLVNGITIPTGCTSTTGYSSTTGQPCSSPIITVIPGCVPGAVYSPTTGQLCTWWTQGPGLPEGCSSSSGFSVTTGQSCNTTVTCPVATPQINVISPNGGEFYTPSQQVTVRWRTCNITADSKMVISLVYYKPGTTSELATMTLRNSTNDGTELVTLPTITSWTAMKYGNNFKIKVTRVSNTTPVISDQSDSLFSISNEGLNVVMGTPMISTVVNQSGQTTSATYSIPLSITPFGSTKYIGQTAQFAATPTGTNAFSFALNSSTAPTTDIVSAPAGITISSTLASPDAIIESQGFRLDDGATKHFTLVVHINRNPTVATPAIYRVHVNAIKTFTNGTLTTGAQIQTLIPVHNYQTQYQSFN